MKTVKMEAFHKDTSQANPPTPPHLPLSPCSEDPKKGGFRSGALQLLFAASDRKDKEALKDHPIREREEA